MANTQSKTDGIETLLNRLGAATDQITKASEKQAREIDKQLKRLVDRGEASTERLLELIDKEIKSQITSLRRELHDVERRVAKLRRAGKKQLAAKQAEKKAPAKKAAAKAAVKKRPPTKKAPAKKTTAKKVAAKQRTTAKRTPKKTAARAS